MLKRVKMAQSRPAICPEMEDKVVVSSLPELHIDQLSLLTLLLSRWAKSPLFVRKIKRNASYKRRQEDGQNPKRNETQNPYPTI